MARVLRSRRRLILDLRAATADLERSREELADRAVTQERLRIARDIHDVVAHSVTVMLVQATAAERTMHRGGMDAIEAIHAVQETAREALAELERLVAQFRNAGLEVECAVSPPHGDPLPGVQLTAYRVVQEALTNVLKHSAAASALVRVHEDGGALVAEVRDGGPARGAVGPGGGHGLAGMRERVAAHGGSLSAGTTAGGGFCVTARLPLGAGS